MQLSGSDYKAIHKALCDAFPSVDDLRQFVRFELADAYDVIPARVSVMVAVTELLNWAQAQSRIDELVDKAKEFNSGNLRLRALPDKFADVGPSMPVDPYADWRPIIEPLQQLLLPYVWTVDERKALLTEALYASRRSEMYSIVVEGDALQFTVRCLHRLLDLDAALLLFLIEALMPRTGTAQQTELQQLHLQIKVRLANQTAQATARHPAVPAGQPRTSMQPVVFLSHSAGEASIADQLRTNLASHGYPCQSAWMHEKGGDAWLQATAEAVSWAQALVVVVGADTWDDRWVKVELLAACDKRKPIVLLQTSPSAASTPPSFLPTTTASIPFDDPAEAFETLLAQLPTPTPAKPSAWTTLSPDLLRRVAEFDYIDRLKLAELQHVAHYTPLAGEAQLQRTAAGRITLPPIVAGPEYAYRPWAKLEQPQAEIRRFDDAITQLKAIRQAVLLGEPGAGKTTTLYRLAADLIDAVLRDPHAPLPLLVRLGTWKSAAEPFIAFLKRSVGELGADLDNRLRANRAVLLLDGLNELPADQHAAKYDEVKRFLAANHQLTVIITCREHDYPSERDLQIDRVTVEPLDPVRINRFIHAYLDGRLGEGAAEDLFWRLVGRQVRATYEAFLAEVTPRAGEPLRLFWLADTLPAGSEWKRYGIWDNWQDWTRERARLTYTLLQLATNPYMLYMLLDVYVARGTLPANRGQLFDQFVERLLVRERLFVWDAAAAHVIRLPEGESLVTALIELAFAMQVQHLQYTGISAHTALPLALAGRHLDERQRYQAASANLLIVGDDVRFVHQLLQEYFAARAMQHRIFAQSSEDRLQAATIWPRERWWEPTILLAGLYSDDCTAVIDWVADVNPYLAARCIVESGSYTPDHTKLTLRQRWLPRLTEGKPHARLRIGDALGLVKLAGGAPLDDRPGVCTTIERNGITLPDIVWGKEAPAGQYKIGGDRLAYISFDRIQVKIAQPFSLSRYPVTYSHFQCFLDAPDHDHEEWWKGMPDNARDFREQRWPIDNRPRESVSWYQAIAFCRWLAHHLKADIDLPTEYEWEVAARYADNDRTDSRFYPWGNDPITPDPINYDGTKLGETSAVGLFPAGRQKVLQLDDLSGNVWEWCRNKYRNPNDIAVDKSDAPRTLRGGPWYNLLDRARAASRSGSRPNYRDNLIGFRLVVRRAPSHGH